MIRILLVIACCGIAVCLGFKASISKDEIISDSSEWSVSIEADVHSHCELNAYPSEAVDLACQTQCNCIATKLNPTHIGLISFNFTGSDISYSLLLKIRNPGESSLYMLSTSAIQELLYAKYHYLALAAIGELKPDFHSYMIKNGFATEIAGISHPIRGIKDCFEKAIELDRDALAAFTQISFLADQEDDHELHEFITNDVITEYTASLKTLSDHLNTINKMMSSDDVHMSSMAEYLFDKLL